MTSDMGPEAEKLSHRYDWDIGQFLTHLGYYLEKYRGPSLEETIETIAKNMDDHGRLLVEELHRKLRGGVL